MSVKAIVNHQEHVMTLREATYFIVFHVWLACSIAAPDRVMKMGCLALAAGAYLAWAWAGRRRKAREHELGPEQLARVKGGDRTIARPQRMERF